MKIHYGETKTQKQAGWLARFSDLLLTRAPNLSGRIDWNAAKHYYFSGMDVSAAVDEYCVARNIPWNP